MKTTPTRPILLALALAAVALPSLAAEATKISNVANSIFFRGGSATRGPAGLNGGPDSSELFDGDFEDYQYCNLSGTTELVIDVTHIIADPNGQAFVTDIIVANNGNGQYSLYYTTEEEPADILTKASDPRTWTPIDGASHIKESAKKTFGVNQIATAVKYVFETGPNWTTALAEVEVQGYEYIPAQVVKISTVSRSIFFRGGSATRGPAGLNGGPDSSELFDGDFEDYQYCNLSGTTELVIPTTGWDDDTNEDTGTPWFVTDIIVANNGNGQYSLYYTTEEEPADILTKASDPRTWTPIDGAIHVKESAKKTFGVNQIATAVKYVFETGPNWTTALAEVEVWAMDPATISCLHEHLDTVTWTICTNATCTANAIEECFCPDCGERFEREVPLSKLGHDFQYTLTAPGTVSSYGSGYVECSRCDEFHIVFKDDVVDLTTLGGPPINGVVQFTDLYASSLGAEDGGIKPIYMMDNIWDNGWGHAYYFAECSSNEYAQYSFGTPIDLTKIEYSVINESQTVYFSKYDPATGVETLLKTIPIVKDTAEGALGYQRRTVTFTREAEGGEEPAPAPQAAPGRRSAPRSAPDDSNASGITVDAIRMRIGDYIDPVTGSVTPYIGYNYGAHDRHTIICEFHPYGTIPGAGKVDSGAKPAFLFMQ